MIIESSVLPAPSGSPSERAEQHPGGRDPAVSCAAYANVARAIQWLRSRAPAQPRLAELAGEMRMSEFQLQRLFSDWAGISPKRFLQNLAVGHARRALRESPSVLDAALAAGLSGPGRLHDLMVSCEALSPGDVRARGRGVDIAFGFGATPFGQALLGRTGRGICALEFIEPGEECAARDRLEADWPEARFVEDPAGAATILERIFARFDEPGRLHVLVKGTNFQIKVWRALLRLPAGSAASYGRLAAAAGVPGAARAVGRALAGNRIAVLIPCHRVLRETGEIGGYRWGAIRKSALIAWESTLAAGTLE